MSELSDDDAAEGDGRFGISSMNQPVGQMLLDGTGRCLQADPGALRMTGLGRAELLERPVWDAGPWARGREELLEQACTEAARGQPVRFELESRDNGSDPLEISLDPICDADGKVTHLLLAARTVGEERRRHAAEGATEALMTMGRYATRMAHEINNPLASIRNAFLLVKEGLAPSHPYYRYVGAIDRELNRLTAISQQLYDVYRLSVDVDAQTTASAIVGDVVDMLCQRFRSASIDLDLDVSADRPLSVPGLLFRQVVYSILLNALEIIPPGEPLLVQAGLMGDTFVLTVRGPRTTNTVDILRRVTEPARGARRYTGSFDIGLDQPLFRHSAHAMGATLKVVDRDDGGELLLEMPARNLAAA